MKQWDVFISHSSEDKPDVVIPLAHALEQRGVRVWLDENEIQLGDSIVGRIEEGLSKSRFGVVVLSPSFFKRKWTLKELRSFHWADNLLPVWHQISTDDIRLHAPLLSDLKAIRTDGGIDVVAAAIAKRLSGASFHRSDADRERFDFAELIRGSRSPIVEFLQERPGVMLHSLGVDSRDYLKFGVQLGPDLRIDAASSSYQPSTSRYGDWKFVWLLEPTESLFDGDGESQELATAIQRVDATRQWIRANLGSARLILPDISTSFRAYIVGGQRPSKGSVEAASLSRLNEELLGTTVRSYQWLLDGMMKEGTGDDG